MARRRKSKQDEALIGFVIIIVIVVAACSWLYHFIIDNVEAVATGGSALFALCVIVVIFGKIDKTRHQNALQIEYAKRATERTELLRLEFEGRRHSLMVRFTDEQVVDAILKGDIWHDMTKEQLVESWGSPAAVDRKVLKTKVKETYKYDQTGVNRFARRAFLENDVVVGWQD